jgi:hypothetical protein
MRIHGTIQHQPHVFVGCLRRVSHHDRFVVDVCHITIFRAFVPKDDVSFLPISSHTYIVFRVLIIIIIIIVISSSVSVSVIFFFAIIDLILVVSSSNTAAALVAFVIIGVPRQPLLHPSLYSYTLHIVTIVPQINHGYS